MDENEAVDQEGIGAATPIFSVYRRGYDPEQVDRYVADQQRRLDETTHRASESERKLAAAVGQLRELHRRVAVYESEARSTQPPALDTLGERVQRILQEAWEGAYNLRQEAEREVNDLREQGLRDVEGKREQAERDVEELRQVASKEAADLVDEATRRALALRDEMDRRREAYLERVEKDRQRAVSQITYLYDQRQLAIAELARLQTTVQATIEEMVRSPLAKPATAIEEAAAARGIQEPVESESDAELPLETSLGPDLVTTGDVGDAGAAAAETLYVDIEVAPEIAEEPAPADETAAAETHAHASPSHVSLFDQIIDDPDTGAAVEEIPTGPMETLGYGYAYGPRTEGETIAAPADAEEAESYDPETAKPRPRHYGGVYDAEADGWG